MSHSLLTPLAAALLALAVPPALTAEESPAAPAPAAPAAPTSPAVPAAATETPKKPAPPDRTAAREQARKKMLERFDADGDGTLNTDERKAAAAEREAKMLERFDADGDGTLSDAERAAARGPLKKQAPGGPAGPGAKKPGAKKPGTPGGAGRGPVRQQLLKKFDTDGDGTLNESERAAAKAARKNRGQPKQK